MIKHIVLIMIFALSLLGCVTEPKHYSMSTKFDENDFERYLVKGQASVYGEVIIDDRYGSGQAGGELIYLRINNAYMKELNPINRSNKFVIDNIDPRLDKFLQFERSTIIQKNGCFSFDDIPAGDFVLEAYPDWPDPQQSDKWIIGRGELPITLGEGERKHVTLTVSP